MVRHLFLVAVVVFGISVAIFLRPDVPITGKIIKLGEGGYDMEVINAPATKGKLLDFLSRMLSQSFLGPFIRRILLNDNKIHLLRELSAQIELAPMSYPMYRMSRSERDDHEVIASRPESSVERALSEGLGHGDSNIYPSVMDYARMYRDHNIKPSDVMKRALTAVQDWEKQGFRVFTSILEDDVMEQALESDHRLAENRPRSVFEGVPIAIKDMLEVHKHTIYDGQNPRNPNAGQYSHVDDIVVSRLRDLGAIIFGVTIMTEAGMSPFGYNTHFQGPTNAFSANHYSGGSSSGNAVAVATGLVPIAVSFDEGGSIRMPAAQAGLHGLAGTYGRVAYGGSMSTLTKCGPIAASAVDAALAYAALAPNVPGHLYENQYDGGYLGVPTPHLARFDDILPTSDRGVKEEIRIGVFWDWFNDSDDRVRALCNDALAFLTRTYSSKQDIHITLVNITIPHLQHLSLSHGIKIAAEFASLWDMELHNAPQYLEPSSRILLGIGSSVTALEVLSAEYLRTWAFDYIRSLFTTHDLTAIATPMLPTLSPPLTEDAKAYGESNTALSVQLMRFSFLANLLGLPATSVPVGFAKETSALSLPVGLQFIGTHWTEDKLLRLAHMIEQGHTNKLTRPKTLYQFSPFDAVN